MPPLLSLPAGLLLIVSLLLVPARHTQAASTDRPGELAVTFAEPLLPFVAVMHSLLKKAGIAYRLEPYPPERARQMVLHGQSDADFFRHRNAYADAGDAMIHVGPIACADVIAFVRKDSPLRIRTAADLRPYQIGIPLGGALQRATVEAAGGVAQGLSEDSLMRMLAAGRLDVVVHTAQVGFNSLQRLGLGASIERRGALLSSQPLYLVVRREKAALVPRLEQALASLISSGEWARQVDAAQAPMGVPAGTSLGCLKSTRQPQSQSPWDGTGKGASGS